jgi:hypothetical protein
MRDLKKDRPKSLEQVAKELGKTCSISGCNNGLTGYLGPNSKILCRQHQLKDIAYPSGYGRSDRLHTYHRSDVCKCCNQNIEEDPRWEKAKLFFGVELSEQQHQEVKRRYNHADHDFRKTDGGNDSEENINAFCTFCHWFKTVIFNDGRKSELDKK